MIRSLGRGSYDKSCSDRGLWGERALIRAVGKGAVIRAVEGEGYDESCREKGYDKSYKENGLRQELWREWKL